MCSMNLLRDTGCVHLLAMRCTVVLSTKQTKHVL